MLTYLSIACIILGIGLAVSATRLPAQQAPCEAMAGALLIIGLLILGAALTHAR